MANRRPQNSSGRRMDFGRKNFNVGRTGVSPWQGGGGPGNVGIPQLLPLGGSTTDALALASNIINLLQPRQNPVPSLLDMPIRREFTPNMGRFDHGGFGPNRMGNQNFRRTGNYNRAGERINNNRKPYRPNDRQQNKTTPKKEADSKPKPKESDEAKNETDTQSDKKTDGQKEGKKTDGQKETPKTRYDDVNPQLLKCHICNKSMWDGRSFENHLSGRAHAIMMQKTAESYALTADTMRQEFKIREMKRTRKSGGQPARDFYCAMCDMYAADGAVHRTTVGHRKLKKYLHPACTSCHKEMPTRIELDEHRLTAEHLKNMHDKQEVVTKPKPEVMVISTLSMEQSYLRDERHRRRRDDGEKPGDEKQASDSKDEGQDEVKIKEEKTDDSEPKAEGDSKKVEDNENTILDIQEGDDLSGVTDDQIPVYSTERGVGRSFLSEFHCYQCKLCHKLLDSEETAEVHLRTWRHHQLFTRALTQDRKPHQPAQAEAETEAEAGAEPEGEGQAEAPKRPLNSEENGNWKRRKTNPEDEQDENCDDDVEEEAGNEAEGEANGGDNACEGEGDMPPAEELEDWDMEEKTDDKEEPKEEPQVEEEEVKPKEVEKVKEKPAPAAESPKATPARATRAAPRGSPRGRGRGRGRH